MSIKIVKDTFVNSPWGKIAFISWGNPENPPILMIHGYMDTAATFTFLMENLPDTYYYVGVDIPGHGKSDPFPEGLLITKLHVVEAIRIVIEHMKWKKFTFLSHSMSCIMGIIYNVIYPDSIENFIMLDPKPALAWYYVIDHNTALWYTFLYSSYYENYQKLNFGKPKSQVYESWINSIARTRNLTKEQSKIVLSRSLLPSGNDTYQLSWEQRAKYLAQVGIPTETLYIVMTKLPPTLVVNASDCSEFIKFEGSKEYVENLLKDCEKKIPHFYNVTVTGGHDFHITNPEPLGELLKNFLKGNQINLKKSKL